jgi:plastocyanin
MTMKEHKVIIAEYSFAPKDLLINTGDTVVWLNQGKMRHTATREEDPKFDTGLIAPGKSSTPIAFTEVSVSALQYFCRPHPFMVGSITVTQANA